jgi:GNAT superfamily N-acetyltransferase
MVGLAGSPCARRGAWLAEVSELASSKSSAGHCIRTVAEADFAALVPLMRAYCDFYRVAPTDHALLGVSRALLGDPEREGLQLIARNADGSAVGFATIFWSWSTTAAGRIGIMHDLYVSPEARGLGVAERLIGACVERCAERGALRLEWQTAPDNLRAQAVYDRVGGVREPWLTYAIAIAADGTAERRRRARPTEDAR